MESSAAAASFDRSARRPGSPTAKRAQLAGWGRYPVSEVSLYRPEKISELGAILSRGDGSLIARGAGRAYGDAALNHHNRVVGLERLNRMLAFDPQSGVLRCEAGVTIAELLEVFLPRGFFPPVTPGTRFVTLGGSLAADVHGKNHHRDSSLSSHVLNFDLMLASGEVRRCSREHNSELFWATVGGMGLTGIILELEVKLRAVESAYLESEVVRVANVDQAIETFEEADRRYQYSVAWIDCNSGGSALGRSVINLGNFAPPERLDARRRRRALDPPPRFRTGLPADLPGFVLNSPAVRAFNALYYAAHRGRAARRLVDFDSFFYPLDAIRNWNRLYGKRGFVQYQCVWPAAESRQGLIETLEAIGRSRRGSFLTVLKKFGAPQEGPLSFPMPGYTLALDFPVESGLLEFLDGLDAMVLRHGGRVYLAKDARMRPEVFREMYPAYQRWQAVKAEADPRNLFSSSLSRRLKMDLP